jgi:uncharacterized protein (UPF0333 family)
MTSIAVFGVRADSIEFEVSVGLGLVFVVPVVSFVGRGSLRKQKKVLKALNKRTFEHSQIEIVIIKIM